MWQNVENFKQYKYFYKPLYSVDFWFQFSFSLSDCVSFAQGHSRTYCLDKMKRKKQISSWRRETTKTADSLESMTWWRLVSCLNFSIQTPSITTFSIWTFNNANQGGRLHTLFPVLAEREREPGFSQIARWSEFHCSHMQKNICGIISGREVWLNVSNSQMVRDDTWCMAWSMWTIQPGEGLVPADFLLQSWLIPGVSNSFSSEEVWQSQCKPEVSPDSNHDGATVWWELNSTAPPSSDTTHSL